jgi:hypothetical protein
MHEVSWGWKYWQSAGSIKKHKSYLIVFFCQVIGGVSLNLLYSFASC